MIKSRETNSGEFWIGQGWAGTVTASETRVHGGDDIHDRGRCDVHERQLACPVAVSGLSGATNLAVGDQHACAIIAAGAIKCWGYNFSGELGSNTTTDSLIPVVVTGLTGATSLGAGGAHTCAIAATGTAKCWGQHLAGQLGNNSPTRSSIPVTALT